MLNFVIKKDGSIEPYNEDKIRKSITIASTRSVSADEDTLWIIDEVLAELAKSFEGMEKVSTEELRKKILKKLNAIAPSVALTWERYKK